MRTFCLAKDSSMESCDRIAIAFGCLYKPTPNNGIKPDRVQEGDHKISLQYEIIEQHDAPEGAANEAYTFHRDHCKACGTVDKGAGTTSRCEEGKKLVRAASLEGSKGESCQYVIFKPIDFHYFLMRSGRIRNDFDRETQQRLVKRGIVGYLWGATVLLDKDVVTGHVVLSSDTREKALRSKRSIVVELQQPFDVISKDFEGLADTHTVWPVVDEET